jgi:hypothetical protein
MTRLHRIVFCDIDGVLNSHRYLAKKMPNGPSIDDDETWERMLDDVAVRRLTRLVMVTGAHLVISSSWRQVHALSQIRRWLHARGFLGVVLDVTPTLSDSSRGQECLAWLADHHAESFVCLDDGGGYETIEDRLVRTQLDVGLLDEDVDRAIAILSTPWIPSAASVLT